MQIKTWFKRSLILIPLAIGIAAVIYAPKMKQAPARKAQTEQATKARIIKPLSQEVRPRAIGYGTTQAALSWDAVAEVQGRVVWVSDQLKPGNLISQGSELMRIDDSEYRLALSQINAQLKTSQVKAETIEKTLAVERRSQALLKKELARQRDLNRKGLLSASTTETAERELIKADAAIQNLLNNLAINQAERETLKVQRQFAELDLARTTIVAPFDLRIVTLTVNKDRYAAKGQALFTADATDKTEIEARFPVGQLRPLIVRGTGNDTANNTANVKGVETVQKGSVNTASQRYPGVMGLVATVRLHTSTHSIEWDAKIERVAGQIDRQTQTLGVIVSVDDPYGKARPGERPPLVRNTFVEVELQGQPSGEQIIIPASALHEGKLYVLDEQNRLEIRKAKPAFTQGGYSVLAGGLTAEEKIIVSDLVPAVQGMLIDPIADQKSRKQLMLAVTGKEPERPPGKKNKQDDGAKQGDKEHSSAGDSRPVNETPQTSGKQAESTPTSEGNKDNNSAEAAE